MSVSPNTFGSVSSDDKEKHKEMILHTLLEEKCIYSAMEELNIRGLTKIKHARNIPVIMSLADEKYQFMCKHLRAVGLVNTDSNAEKLTSLRQGYRHGLDFLSKAASSANSDAELSLLADSLQRAGNEKSINILQHDEEAVAMISKTSTSTPSANVTDASLSPVSAALQSLLNHQVQDVSRFRRDFLELGMIGRGGYGKVFSVQHKLDGVRYAVKKIGLNISSTRMIGREGCRKLDCLLKELRTLAKMDHPNIVRYFGGWLEYSISDKMSSTTIPQSAAPRKLLEEDFLDDSLLDTVSSSTYDIKEGQPESLNAPAEMLPEDVIFENSSPENILMSESSTNLFTGRHVTCKCSRCRVSRNLDTMSTEGRSFSEKPPVESTKEVRCTRALAISPIKNVISSYGHTQHSGFVSQSYTESRANMGSYAAEPSLTLYIQMSLHPFSLADFIDHDSPLTSKPDADVQKLCHCFHASISLQILLTLMDGVQYLHGQGIVHRDIKPANVFLDVSSTTSQQARCVNLSACPECQVASTDANDELDRIPAFLSVRIGDFGLAAAISRSGNINDYEENAPAGPKADPDSTTPSDAQSSIPIFEAEESQPPHGGAAVGTYFYKPPTPTATSRYSKLPDLNTDSQRRSNRVHELTEKLDVYAIGIILLELLCPFTTQMERRTVLSDIRHGILRDDLTAWQESTYGAELKTLVSEMVSIDESKRLGCDEIRRRVESILTRMKDEEEEETKRREEERK